MTGVELLVRCGIGATLVLAVVFAFQAAIRGSAAARRHFVWTATLAGLLLLPAATLWMPKVGRLPGGTVVTVAGGVMDEQLDTEVVVRPSRPARETPWGLLWLAGCGLATAWFAAGRLRIARVVRKARAAEYVQWTDGGRIRVLESEWAPTIFTAGIWRPAILLPPSAREWPPERLEAALLHERMHVERRDLLAQAIAQVACCLYWFHPLVWMAAREQRRERERACDDAVLARGVSPHEYAGHLVALVRAMGKTYAEAMMMAEPSDLEARVKALLDERDRRPLSGLAIGVVAGVLLMLMVPLASVTLRAQAVGAPALLGTQEVVFAPVDEPQQTAIATVGALGGTVEDPSGAYIPGAIVLAKNLDGGNQEETRANAAGQFRFNSIPTGRYSVEVRSPGFAVLRSQVPVTATAAGNLRARLVLGSAEESVTVSGGRAPMQAPRASASDPRRIRVGGMVQPAKILAKVEPVYPEDLKARGVTGVVVLQALVTKFGYLSNVAVVNTDVDPGLAKAALEAVQRWIYQPSLLNGEPVEMVTKISVRFELE